MDLRDWNCRGNYAMNSIARTPALVATMENGERTIEGWITLRRQGCATNARPLGLPGATTMQRGETTGDGLVSELGAM